MKILISTIFMIATFSAISANACSVYSQQAFPSVPLSQFGVNSWMVAKAPVLVQQVVVCPKAKEEIIGHASVPTQHFPSVPLYQFGVNSWMVAK